MGDKESKKMKKMRKKEEKKAKKQEKRERERRQVIETVPSLLEETIIALHESGKSPEDVLWVGDNQIHFPWEHFCSIAGDERYIYPYGIEAAEGLAVVGDDWWLERDACPDGGVDEHWRFRTKPKASHELLVNRVANYVGDRVAYCPTLRELNEDQFKDSKIPITVHFS